MKLNVHAPKEAFMFMIAAIVTLSIVLTPWAEKAQAEEAVDMDRELTAEEQKQADQIAENLTKMSVLAQHLSEEERQQLNDASVNGTETSVAMSKDQVASINDQLAAEGVETLPENTTSFDVNQAGEFVAETADDGSISLYGFWGGAWKVTKCAGHLGLVIFPGMAAFRAVKALGGMKTTAELLVKAGSVDEFIAIGGGAAAEIVGIQGVQENCF
ncbi:hypothetical protein [Marinococcus halotolerans]|uniref:hypothetical protein n=1 Tax=Marinococcus halotolerans TaxID=301092 RepID=UPI0003B410CB|nr:hypothetical protein [Marinococcus halotolerans]